MTESDSRPVSIETQAELDELVASRDRVLVELYTDSCGICQSMEPVLDGVARTSDATVVTVNPRDDPELIETYDVQSVPKLLLFVDGELVETRAEGFLGVDEVLAFVDGN